MDQRRDDADFMAMNAFLNALIREWGGWRRAGHPICGRAALAIPVSAPESGALYVRILKDGILRLRFDAGAFWCPDRDEATFLDAEATITLLTSDPVICPVDEATRAGFRKRCLASLAAQRRATRSGGKAENWSFIEAEQALTSGHPLHPNPRSRDGMLPVEEAIYAPEHRDRFPLVRILARETMVAGDGAARALELLQSDPEAAADIGEIPEGFIPLPFHPWQVQHILEMPFVKKAISRGDLIPKGASGYGWAATASMRCLWQERAPFMLKTSLTLRLTNSLRHLNEREIRRGAQFRELFDQGFASHISVGAATLNVLQERGWTGLRHPDGSIAPETLAIYRDNPFTGEHPGPVMLASLCEDGPKGSPLGAMIRRLGPDEPKETARRWFGEFLRVALHPLLWLRGNTGVLIGAHQQNMMLGLREGWPDQLWVRDGQGVGQIGSWRGFLEAWRPGMGKGTANSVSAELGDGLLCYYVIVNNVLNVASALALDDLGDETDFHTQLHEMLMETCPGLTDRGFCHRLLNNPGLTAKGNFMTSLRGVNEADGDANGQLAAFLELPNPLGGFSSTTFRETSNDNPANAFSGA